MKKPFIVIAAIALTACNPLMPPLPDESPTPLVVASCPDLTPLNDDSFGATSLKLIEVAGQYRKCRQAALGDKAR